MTRCDITCEPHDDSALRRRAGILAEQLNIPFRPSIGDVTGELALVVTSERLELRVLRGPLRGGRSVFADRSEVDVSPGAGGRLGQPIAKAVGRRKGQPAPTILDATGGFGLDAWLLASLGCRVTCVERHPVIASLLEDARHRAEGEPAAERIRVLHADCHRAHERLGGVGSARRGLSGPDVPAGPQDSGAQADARAAHAGGRRPGHRGAIRRRGSRRPLLAAPLGGKPDVTYKGKATRYDAYLARPTP